MSAAKKQKKKEPPKFWVGIGASAGGLEALRGFVRYLPKNISAAYIVTQHVAPQHRSMLTEIIGRETHLPVLELTDKLNPKADTIYITPPNNDLIVKDGLLRLTPPSKKIAAPKPSVNTFFQSLAAAKGSDAIGIVLSGTGSDGAIGMTAIHEAGGITIAQDYMTAKYSSMPVAAVDTGNVDLVMSPEEMAAQFSKIAATPRNLDALRSSPVNMDSLSELTQILLDHTKVNFRHYKTATFQRRVERRIAATGATTLEEYVAIARRSSEEVEALFRDLLITVTSFFRDKSEFEALRESIRKIIKNRDGQAIRVWVAGTATGEEAYTIAIIFAEEMGGPIEFANARIQIFASDLDAEAIEVARRGYYAETALVEVPDTLVRRYFQRATMGFTVNKSIREKIVFSVHNIGQDPPLLNLDLVSCRNLLIYFQPELQRQVLTRFHYALKSRGILFLGKSETASVAEGLFTSANSEKHIFHQRPSQTPNMLPRDMYQQPAMTARTASKFISPNDQELETVKGQFTSLIKALGPNCLLVDANLKVSEAFGDVGRYVRLAAGPVDGTTTSLLIDPFRQDVRAAVPGVIRNNEPYLGLVRRVEEDETRRVRLRILPIENTFKQETQALIIFEEWTETDVDLPGETGSEDNEHFKNEIKSLTDELKIAKSNLMQMVEELETSNEELQALNEELQSSNEELQSTNEELETSNEELQSTNEELSTVNEEMQVNAQQLGSLNQNLSSILENISVPLLVVDRHLNITNLSRTGENFFGISPELALPHISRCTLPKGMPELSGLLDKAMAAGQKIDQVIDLDDINATLTIAPQFSNVVDLVGAIVLVTNNTTALKEARDELQLLFENLPASILVHDKAGDIKRANTATSEYMEKTVKELENSNMSDLYDDARIKAAQKADKIALKTGKASTEKAVRHTSPSGIERYFNTSRVPFSPDKNEDGLVYAMAIDVTDEYHARKKLEQSEKRLDEAVQLAGVGHWEWDTITGAVYWSPNFERLLGMTIGSFDGTLDDFLIRVHPDDIEHLTELMEAQHQSDVPFSAEYRLRHQKGHSIWVHASGRNRLDANGKFNGMTGTIQDITEAKRTELKIKESNEQLQLASQMASLGFWKIDLKTQSLFWSSEIYAIHGVEEGKFIPTLDLASGFIHPDDRKEFDALYERAKNDLVRFAHEFRILRPNDQIRTVSMRAEIETDAKGKIASIFGTIHDVTDDREARAALIESENKLEQAINASGLGLWEMHIARKELTWSKRYHQILGLDPATDQLTQKTAKALIHPDDQSMIDKAYKAHFTDSEPFDCEFRLRHSDGHYIWVRDTAETIRDETGKPTRTIGMISDITERKVQTLNLRALNEQLSLASRLSAVGYWQIDVINDTLFWSDEVFRIHGETPETHTPNLASGIDYYHPDDQEMVTKAVNAALEDKIPFEFEARIKRADGEIRTVSSSSSIDFGPSGEVSSIFGVFKDVTEDRQREQELKDLLAELSRSNEELNRFSYVCSHDMKEPVRMIESMSQMLLDPDIQSDQTQRDEILTRINTNMIRLRAIIDSLLAYSRVEAKVEVKTVDLNQVVDEVLETLDLSIKEQNTKVSKGKMPTLEGAHVHFMQLFQNLVQNALKHSDVNSPAIKISSTTRKGDIILRVEDNGRGVPKKSREQIFELFGRLKRRDEAEGTGLGLSICKKIVAQYAGTIKCYDSKLGGAMFEITIPSQKA